MSMVRSSRSNARIGWRQAMQHVVGDPVLASGLQDHRIHGINSPRGAWRAVVPVFGLGVSIVQGGSHLVDQGIRTLVPSFADEWGRWATGTSALPARIVELVDDLCSEATSDRSGCAALATAGERWARPRGITPAAPAITTPQRPAPAPSFGIELDDGGTLSHPLVMIICARRRDRSLGPSCTTSSFGGARWPVATIQPFSRCPSTWG